MVSTPPPQPRASWKRCRRKVAEQLTRHWLISTLIRNIKIGMTDIPARQTRVRTKRKRADGSIVYETTVIEVYERDAAAVVSSCKLLLAECDRREAKSAEIKAADEQNAGPSLGARLLETSLRQAAPRRSQGRQRARR